MVDLIRFADVCHVFDRVERVRRSSNKQDVFVAFFKSIPALLTDDAFPLLRLLVPKFDREMTYGISVKKIAALYIDANAWPAQGHKATRLAQWADKKQATKASGVSNFTNVLETILREEGLVQESNWTVADVNVFLEEVKDVSSHAERLPLWRKISLELTSALEHKYLMRIILKDLKLGIGENTILATFHPAAVDWYNVTSDLHLVCSNALQRSPSSYLDTSSEISISPENPIRPMLAARVAWTDIEEQMKFGIWAVELKFDGERCLIHKMDGRFKLFSRNQIELSEKYPDYLTSLEPYLKNISAESCILDGELVVWDDSLGGFASFGTNRSVAAGQIPNCHLAYVAFDIIYWDGKSQIHQSLRERRKVLQKCIPSEVPHRFEISKQETISEPEQITTALDYAIDQGNEGLLIKNLDSVYSTGTRDKNFWMKVKADYLLSDAMCDTIDGLILGVYFGKRNSFLLGVGNQGNLDPHGHPKSFYTFLRVGSGFTQDELNMVLERLEPHYRKFDRSSPPSWFEPLASQFLCPNVVIDPCQSIVLEIKGYEIHSTNKQSCGYTVRFPTVVRIRTDKLWYECWTMNDVQSIVSGPNRGRICYNVREKLLSVTNRTKKTTASKVFASLPSNKFGKVDVKSALFEGLRIHVRSCTSRYSTTDIQKMIVENAGELALNLTKETARKVDIVIIGDRTVQVENLIRMSSSDVDFDVDIIQFQWMEDCIAQSEQLLFYPWYWIHLSQRTRSRLKAIMDVETGIVWGRLPDKETCKRIYACYRSRRKLEDSTDDVSTTSRGLKRFRKELGTVKYDLLWTSTTMFRDVVAFAVFECQHASVHGNPCCTVKMIANCIKVYSGRIVSDFHPYVTHTITCDITAFKFDRTVHKDIPDSTLKSIKLIDKMWLDNCLEGRGNRTVVASCDLLYAKALSSAAHTR